MLGLLHDFEMHRGDDRTLTYTVVDQQSPPQPIDITAATITWILAEQDPTVTAEPQPKKDGILVSKSVSSGITITDAAAGDFEVALDSSDTATRKAPNTYYHEVQIVLGGETTTIVYGIITLKREIIAPGP